MDSDEHLWAEIYDRELTAENLADSLSLQINYCDLYVLDYCAPRQDALDKALALNPRSGEAHTSLANLRQEKDKDELAETLFLKAIELSPNYATALRWYSILLNELDRDLEALEKIDLAIELDPNAPILGMARGTILWELGRREEAIVYKRRQLEMSFPPSCNRSRSATPSTVRRSVWATTT